MHLEIQGEVYFTLHQTESISSVFVVNGTVIARETFPQGQPPQSWVNALREMSESLGKDQNGNGDPVDASSSHPTSFSLSNSPNSPSLQNDSLAQANSISFMESLDTHLSSSNYSSPVQQPSIRDGPSSPSFTFSSTVQRMNAHETRLFTSLSASSSPPHPIDPELGKPSLSFKRMQKLQNLLAGLRNQHISSLVHHNQQVDGLYSGPQFPSCLPTVSIMQFAEVLSRLGNVSDTVGNVYGLLSWEIFRMEEERLVHKEGLSPNFAAKQMNRKMAEALQRRGKAKDWASDGRRAAKMVFGALRHASVCVKSFALILLGGKGYCSLDSMLKIAHFPALRTHFERQFSEMVQSRTAEWEFLEVNGYKVFDYEEFLRLRGPPTRGRGQLHTPPLDSVFEWSSPMTGSPEDSLNTALPGSRSSDTHHPSLDVWSSDIEGQGLSFLTTNPEASTMDCIFQQISGYDQLADM